MVLDSEVVPCARIVVGGQQRTAGVLQATASIPFAAGVDLQRAGLVHGDPEVVVIACCQRSGSVRVGGNVSRARRRAAMVVDENVKARVQGVPSGAAAGSRNPDVVRARGDDAFDSKVASIAPIVVIGRSAVVLHAALGIGAASRVDQQRSGAVPR